MRLGVTIGDPHGVGPEILLRAHALRLVPGPFVVIGDAVVLERCAAALGLDLPDDLEVHDLGALMSDEIRPGELSAAAGQAAWLYLQRGIAEAQAGSIDALVTLPVNKAATALSVPGFTGHTGALAAACGNPPHTMALVSDELITTFVSTHVPLRQAIELVTRERIAEVTRLTAGLVERLGRRGPIALAGLNPHAGEGGTLGSEELEVIAPAVAELSAGGLDVRGPEAPDTAFLRARQGEFSAVVSMYHDQGHVAMKTLGLDQGINVTVGLPFCRTSPDHGTAFDIAWRGVASLSSFVRACELAVRLA